MTKGRKKRIIWALTAGFAVLIPLALLAYEYGPDPRYTGAPGDSQLACAAIGCHTGSSKGGPMLATTSTAGVTATFAGCSSNCTYTPGGSAITITVNVTDPTNKHFGFQMTARSGSTTQQLSTTQAGSFSPGGSTNVQVICDDGSNLTSKGCPGNFPVQFVEHFYPAGSQVSTTPYTFMWTPPATNVGSVQIYIAGNAVNGNLQADSGDHVYTNSYTLTPASAPACTNSSAVTITSVNSASGFGGSLSISPGNWIEIKGTNLAPDTRSWATSDFSGNNAPTSLDGTSVTVNGKAAYVSYISSTQVNVQTPADTTTGSINVIVKNCNASSPAFAVQEVSSVPGMLAPSSFLMSNTQYMVALIPDTTLPLGYAFVGQTTWFPGSGYSTRPAKPGDSLVAYGVGFGGGSPGVIVTSAANELLNSWGISFGSTPATVSYAGLAPGFVGLYQFNFKVPASLANGDYVMNVTLNGTKVSQTMSLTVHN